MYMDDAHDDKQVVYFSFIIHLIQWEKNDLNIIKQLRRIKQDKIKLVETSFHMRMYFDYGKGFKIHCHLVCYQIK